MSTVDNAPRTESPRSKRAVIIATAIDRFGEEGFEHTKWATIADDVGIGQTALYHYFESKVHCLLTIMRLELSNSVERFRAATESAPDSAAALTAAVASAYEASPRDALQRRILQNHMDLLATKRPSKKEEEERLLCRSLVQEIEHNWTGLVQKGIDDGAFRVDDALLTARMLLALVVGVWRWYRPGGEMTLEQITEVMAEAAARLVDSAEVPART
ncbi:TetR family transcriptional regulator [Aeromicrobium sp. Root344]|uniref:TetR/AcrR family transcriptional regulator n=1 Tax=Aeromicrobium sp. Root344 TaxID=1736521 RepID=UPI0006FA58C4|nr:TetR/AcrR family transcriptional regulator [Aeromicrobium sp. Root344]KQV73788.1 TetR family transcriptional regulator [Aeromicrobium sp. Root344]